MNYRVKPEQHKWAVLENRSGLVIEYCVTKNAANKLARSLNRGRGFDGWSPPFICTKEPL